jgi:uncharacterized repeat protein (TIGR01451 family)
VRLGRDTRLWRDRLISTRWRGFTVTLSSTTADSCKEYGNVATADASNSGEVTANATETVLCPDIDVEKTGTTGPVSAGEPITFQITVINLGPGQAYGVMFTDDLGALGLINVLEDHADCGILAGVMTCNFGTMDVGLPNAEVVNITADTTPASCAGLDNQVTVTSTNENSFSLGNNTDNHAIEVDCPDILVEKEGNETITAGERVFTITVTQHWRRRGEERPRHRYVPNQPHLDRQPGRVCPGMFMGVTLSSSARSSASRRRARRSSS